MEGKEALALRLAVGFFLFYLVLGQSCERYWLLHDGTCFRKFADQVSYLEAKKQCNSARARLLGNLTDGLEVNLLGHSEQNENSSYWCKTGSDGDDMFSMPRLILERRRRSTSCCFIQNLEYEMGECDELRGYICEKDPIPLVHICLQNITSSSDASDWESARRYCQCNGGDLYSFNATSEEEHFLQLVGDRNQSVWIGLRREADSDDFMWSDGTPFTHLTWDGGQPNRNDNSKLCVAYAAQNSTWEVADCNSRLSFICKPSGTRYDVSSDETATETDPYYISNDYSTEETGSFYASSEDTEMPTNWYTVAYEDSTMETDLYNISYDDTAVETALNNTSSAETTRTTENPLWNTVTEVVTTETPLTNSSITNSTAEAGYISACSPVFEDCYVAAVVVGVIILLTATVIAVVYKRLRTKKEKPADAPVQLLHVHSYKEDVPAKLLAAKIKEVIA